MEKINKNDPIVRTAIYESYNKKCFYCKELIAFNNFQIDHIIPKDMGKEQAIKKYGLSEDFELDSYYNLLPTCFSCNNQKRAKQFEKDTILYYLNIVEDKVPKLIELEEKLNKDKTKTRILNELKRKLKLGIISVDEIETIKADYYRANRIETIDYFEEFKRKMNLEILKRLKPNFMNFMKDPQYTRLEVIIYVTFMIGSLYFFIFLNINVLIWILSIFFFFLVISSKKFIKWKKKMKKLYEGFKKLEDEKMI